ncbi:protein ELC-like [Cornus florida]|uniref:protein ELC-like n=1 Tax=Cornus florida TaxID=4283 RepID=UPI00289EF7BB|nr:protein ELC-like [Cornus florida]
MVPPSAGSSSPNAQYTLQFLSSVLSQRGPSALPYTEDAKWLIRQHLLSLSDAFPSLQPKTSTFTHNDGTTVHLLQADGTVPMLFQNVTYNIPIVIWLMESYPRHKPIVFVNPTQDMVIKRPHQYVNPSGMVSIPYLHNWLYPSSNLVDLARNLSHFFGRDPPVFSQRRPNPNPNPNPNTGYPQSLLSSNSMSDGSRPAIPPPRGYLQSPYGSSGRISSPGLQRPPPAMTEDPTEMFRRNAMGKLVESLHTDIGALRKTREAEVEGLFNAQAVLRQKEEQLLNGLRRMQDEKEGLEQQLQMVLMNSDILEGWLIENEGKLAMMGNVDVDEAFKPCDALSKQMLDCTASDLAIEDVIYSLDKAIQEWSIPLDQYLRNVRLLSREQFFHRATSSKVRAAQMQSQVTSKAAQMQSQVNDMAARISQYVG